MTHDVFCVSICRWIGYIFSVTTVSNMLSYEFLNVLYLSYFIHNHKPYSASKNNNKSHHHLRTRNEHKKILLHLPICCKALL